MNADVTPGSYKVPPIHLQSIRDADALVRFGHDEDAAKLYEKVLEQDGSFLPALINLAVIRDRQGRTDEITTLYERAIALNPDDPHPRYFFGLHLLSTGDLSRGWLEYRHRLKRQGGSQLYNWFKPPFWRGEPLRGRSIVVWTEQGVGDEILISSMFSDIFKTGAKVSIVCTKEIVSLFKRSFPECDIFTKQEVIEKSLRFEQTDFQASLTELGEQFRPTFNSFAGAGEPWIKPPYYPMVKNMEKFGEKTVGISWRSFNRIFALDKSMTLEAWLPILKTPGIKFVSVQHGDVKEEIDKFNKKHGINIITTKLETVDDYAAAVAACDLVISVSNTNVHLAGSMGVPCWNIVPFAKGRIWYWFLNNSLCPWYPSVTIFRRTPFTYEGSDEGLITSLATKLKLHTEGMI